MKLSLAFLAGWLLLGSPAISQIKNQSNLPASSISSATQGLKKYDGYFNSITMQKLHEYYLKWISWIRSFSM
ncbi:hypothetical protein OQY15_00535 [Pedobacter sp. MC2016-15]|uniref:hypothetical protein n=1 Tax=Pedobacter sp. MC2016-15 TaxID=2994473 RepID=UPI002244FF7B|nr:hypothetical protein [Pedobacter sp. MC2016-15]MCX2477553.1 hypothetical protein [Pedobacter sp. MC2016-15]